MTVTTTGSAPETSLLDEAFPPGTLRILQLTDTHIYADSVGELLGINTLDSFQAVLRHFRETHWPLDLLLATGDLVHDASPRGYARMAGMLSGFGVPVLSLPGNHDKPGIMQAHLRAPGVYTQGVSDHGGWRFVMLDSVIPDAEGGHLRDEQLRLLDRALASTDHHVLVCLHHQPVNVGSAWIDTMAISNPEAFFDIIDRYDCVRGILWGHVHQTYEGNRNGVRLMASPSTCVQFAPNVDDFEVDHEPPGFRILALHADGAIRSEVVRTDEMPHGLDLASSGY
jgi:Icc protein